MAATALIIAGVLIYLISGSQGFFKARSKLYTYMDDSAALAKGAPVRLNGFLIGQVSNVELTGSTQKGRIVRVTLDIDDKYLKQIPVDSQAEIAALNLLGTKYINIAKGLSTQTIAAGGEIKSANTPGMEDWLKQGNTLIGGMQDMLTKADAIITDIQAGKGTLGKFLVDEAVYNKFLAIMDQIQKLTETLNSNRGIGKFINDDALYTDVRGTVTRINNLMDEIDQGQGTLGKFIKDPAMYDQGRDAIVDLRKGVATLNQLLDGLQKGEGTAGKLLKSDELSNQIKDMITRLDAILEKVNNGQGTIGMLMNNPALYEDLDGLTRESHGLIKDFRANPKKFLRITLGLF
ncbi:MAG TPA: MlaD family protein [Bryobacteraceae bacterium]|nr:MlaD family protein [Bryobacteraceae bacterium]